MADTSRPISMSTTPSDILTVMVSAEKKTPWSFHTKIKFTQKRDWTLCGIQFGIKGIKRPVSMYNGNLQ